MRVLVDIGPFDRKSFQEFATTPSTGDFVTFCGGFSDEPLAASDYELAAKLSNQCRAAGIVGSPVDFLLCAVATGRNRSIFTSDGVFKTFVGVFPITLHGPRGVNR